MEKILGVSPKRLRSKYEDMQYQSASYKTAEPPLPLSRRQTVRTTCPAMLTGYIAPVSED